MKPAQSVTRSLGLLALAAVLLSAAGCVGQTRYTIAIKEKYGVWPKNTEYEKIGPASGKDSNFNLLYIWGVTPPPSYEFAALQAINEKKGDGLVNVRVEKVEQYWFVGSVEIYEVHGQVVRFKKADSSAGPK